MNSKSRLWTWVVIPLLALAGLTFYFRLPGRDLAFLNQVREWFGVPTWADGDQGFWRFVKTYGVAPGFGVAFAAIGGVFVALRNPKRAHWLKPSLFLIAVLAVGSGLIANMTLKDHYGRPRPKQVLELGGTQEFRPVLTPNLGGPGKSFPAGHPTMGFYLFALGLLFPKRRAIAWACHLTGWLLGVLLGITRIVQGGHWPSDVVWAAAIMWFTAVIFYRLMNLDAEPAADLVASSRLRRKPIAIALAVCVVLLISAAFVSIPFSRSTPYPFQPVATSPSQLIFRFEGNLKIETSDHCELRVDGDGCGTPKAFVGLDFTPIPGGFVATENRHGILTERNLNAVLLLAPGDYRLTTAPTVRVLPLPSGIAIQSDEKGVLQIHVGAP